MILTTEQLRIIKGVIGVIEVGKPTGGYDNVTLYRDGPGKIRQVTYGRFQTTEFSNLKELVRRYVETPGAIFADKLRPYLSRIGRLDDQLAGDAKFVGLLKDAAKRDKLMPLVQDTFFDEVYFAPALKWCKTNGLKTPLGAMIVMDSFIHGSFERVRELFREVPPSKGGTEEAWLTAYVSARHAWLLKASALLASTTYRTRCWMDQIARKNWDLSKLPIIINGSKVS